MSRKTQKKHSRGFTLLEIIIAMTLMVFSLSLTTSFVRRSQISADINTQTGNLVFHLRLAQSNAMSGLNNSAHGVHLEPDSYTVYQGSNYNPNDPLNFTEELPSTFTIQDISIHHNGSEILFTPPEGQTENYGEFTIAANDIDITNTITINQYGTISY